MSQAAHPPGEPGGLTLERLRQVLDLLDEGVAILDARGALEYVNRAGEALLGPPLSALVGTRALDIQWSVVDEAGRPLDREEVSPFRVLATGLPHGPMIVGVTFEGVPGPRWVEVGARPLPGSDPAGAPSVLTFFRDISAELESQAALRVSERRYQLLVRSVPTGIFHADASGACVWANDTMVGIVGVPMEAYLGFGWVDLVHPDDRARVEAGWRSAADRRVNYEAEHRYLRPDGEVRWVTCRAVELTDESGERTGWVGSVQDITSTKAAAQVKDQLIGLVSHELRAPLVAIRGGLQFLAPHVRQAEEEGRRLYDMAVRNAEYLERLVRDLLDIERLEGGQLKLTVEAVRLADLFNQAMEVVAPLAGERGVRVEGPPDGGPTIQADRDRILQVATNLLSNAVKFTEPGGTVRVDYEVADGWVIARVADTGRGIPPEFHERIFERFGQVRPSDASEWGGAGLGLAITRAIVQRHGGRIAVESEPGRGSTFSLRLPGPSAETDPT